MMIQAGSGLAEESVARKFFDAEACVPKRLADQKRHETTMKKKKKKKKEREKESSG